MTSLIGKISFGGGWSRCRGILESKDEFGLELRVLGGDWRTFSAKNGNGLLF